MVGEVTWLISSKAPGVYALTLTILPQILALQSSINFEVLSWKYPMLGASEEGDRKLHLLTIHPII